MYEDRHNSNCRGGFWSWAAFQNRQKSGIRLWIRTFPLECVCPCNERANNNMATMRTCATMSLRCLRGHVIRAAIFLVGVCRTLGMIGGIFHAFNSRALECLVGVG